MEKEEQPMMMNLPYVMNNFRAYYIPNGEIELENRVHKKR